MLTPSLVVGFTIMALGITLLLNTLGIADISTMFRFWPVILILFGASLVAESRRPVDANAPGAQRRKGVPCFLFFVLILAMMSSWNWPGTRAAVRDAASAINVTGVMHRANRTGGTEFRHGRVAAVMGRSSLDLRRVTPGPGEEVVVDVFVAMGRASVRIPDHWVVDTSALPVMGAVEQERFTAFEPQFDVADEGKTAEGRTVEGKTAEGQTVAGPPSKPTAPPRLVLRGFIMMGKVDITS